MACRLVKRYMGGSTKFDGATSTIVTDITSNDVFKTGNGFTMWRWIKPNSYGESTGGRIFDKTEADGAINGVKMQLLASGKSLLLRTAGTSVISANNSIALNRWSFVLSTVAPDATVTHYINGRASGTPATAGILSDITTANALTIGNRSGATDYTFSGLMGEGGILPRVATAEEIRNIMNGILPSDTAHFFPLSDQPSTYLDTIGGATGTGTATTYSPDVPVQLPVVIDGGARSSLSFDGSGDGIALGAFASQLNSAYSYIGIVKPTTSGGKESIFRGSVADTLWFNIMEDLTLRSYHSDLTPAGVQSDVKIEKNKYSVVAVTFTGTVISIYLNGQLIKTSAVTGTLNLSGNINIGGNGDANDYNGYMKSCLLFKRALTSQEIKDYTFNLIIPSLTSVFGVYTLNEGAGTIAYDSSGNGNNGTITGAIWSADVPSKARTLVNGNLVPNGDFSYVPRVNVAVTTQQRWLDGTSGGSTTNNLFKFALTEVTNNAAAVFETKDNVKTLKASTTGVNSVSTFSIVRAGDASRVLPSGIKLRTNTQYTVTLYMESMAISGSATTGARAFINLYNALGAYSSTIFIVTGVVTTTNKTKYSVTFTTGASETIGTIWGGVTGNDGAATLIMDAWFADIQLQETTLPTRTTATTRTTVTCP